MHWRKAYRVDLCQIVSMALTREIQTRQSVIQNPFFLGQFEWANSLSWLRRPCFIDFISRERPSTSGSKVILVRCINKSLQLTLLSDSYATPSGDRVYSVIKPLATRFEVIIEFGNQYICLRQRVKVGLKSRFQSFIEFAFSVLLEPRKSLLCVIFFLNNNF